MEQWLLFRKRKAGESNATSESSENKSLKTKRRTCRKYLSEYLLLGFTSLGPEDNPLPPAMLGAKTYILIVVVGIDTFSKSRLISL